MRVLIIGGTGLISTAITRFLIERGDAVTLYGHSGVKPMPLGLGYKPANCVHYVKRP